MKQAVLFGDAGRVRHELDGADVDLTGWEGSKMLCDAVHSNPDIVRLLLDHGADPMARTAQHAEYDGLFSPLQLAFLSNALATIIAVAGRVDQNDRDQHDDTPIHWACTYGNTDIVRFFIQTGADVEARNESGETPLDCAIKRNDNFSERAELLALFQELAPEAYFTAFCQAYVRM